MPPRPRQPESSQSNPVFAASILSLSATLFVLLIPIKSSSYAELTDTKHRPAFSPPVGRPAREFTWDLDHLRLYPFVNIRDESSSGSEVACSSNAITERVVVPNIIDR